VNILGYPAQILNLTLA